MSLEILMLVDLGNFFVIIYFKDKTFFVYY